MKLIQKQYYICYSASPEVTDSTFSVTLTTDVRSLLLGWGPTTRISPVWRLAPNLPNADLNERESSGTNILFLSGVSPDWLVVHLSNKSLSLLGDDSILLTLGVFSLVIISSLEEITAEIIELCTSYDIAYENWHCSDRQQSKGSSETYFGTEIERVNPTEFKLSGQRSLTSKSRELFDHATIQADDSIGLMALELYALLAVIESRATGAFSVLSQDCVAIEAMTTQLTSRVQLANSNGVDPDRHPKETDFSHLAPAEPQDLLLTLNAALSRLSSQALSGTSPITQTECHFWPHSFLAIGVASLALRNVASFITSIVGQARFSEIYNLLLDLPAKWSQLEVTGRNTDLPAYLDQQSKYIDSLPGHGEGQSDSLNRTSNDDPAPTPITYFSGRDGFRNDPLTMSAPLPSVSGCNSHQWNLGTITHELSHRILSGKIEKLLNGLLRSIDELGTADKVKVKKFFTAPPKTIREQAERLLGFTLAVMCRDGLDKREWNNQLKEPGILFRSAKERYGVQIEETLVHIFDFYHFYDSNAKSYVDFVWLSWAVQPMIMRRQDEYIKRTLTALAIKHFYAENWEELAIDEFSSLLKSEPLMDRLSMQQEILNALSDGRLVSYLHHLKKMRHLISLFYLVFKSPELARLADIEGYPPPKPGGRRGKKQNSSRFGYAATQLIFSSDDPSVPETRFTNPLRFLRDYSRSHKPNAAKSAWLLHMLAFNFSPIVDGQVE